jgi:hypothetical protein
VVRSSTNITLSSPKLISSTAAIGPLDGKVGAVIMDGEYFITLANQQCIFAPPHGDQHKVQLHADSRYGDNDPVLWPQPYMLLGQHLS